MASPSTECDTCANMVFDIGLNSEHGCKRAFLELGCKYEVRFAVPPDWHEQQQKKRKKR